MVPSSERKEESSVDLQPDGISVTYDSVILKVVTIPDGKAGRRKDLVGTRSDIGGIVEGEESAMSTL